MKYIYVAYPLVGMNRIGEDCESFTSMRRCQNWVLEQKSPYVISIERADGEVYKGVKDFQPKVKHQCDRKHTYRGEKGNIPYEERRCSKCGKAQDRRYIR